MNGVKSENWTSLLQNVAGQFASTFMQMVGGLIVFIYAHKLPLNLIVLINRRMHQSSVYSEVNYVGTVEWIIWSARTLISL